MSISKFLFGEIALKKKLVTRAQVEECLQIQEKLKEMGIVKTLGAIMHDKKYLTMMEVKEILREMTGTKDWNAIEGYEILGKLGKGGMGSVYKAKHTKLNRDVAIKILSPEMASNKDYLDRFLREARAAAKLNHPNIVQALDVGESYGYNYFVMEFVDGETAKEIIDREGLLTEEEASKIAIQITRALQHAWEYNLIHRDIKPSNIMLNKNGVAKLCDLGLAKSVTEDTGHITQTGVVLGTPFYLSPEQARSESMDIRSDIYSLGVTLYHMVTGQVPFTGNSAASILYKHMFMDPPKPKALNPRISLGLNKILLKMLAKDPDERFQTPSEILEAFEELQREPAIPGKKAEELAPRLEEKVPRRRIRFKLAPFQRTALLASGLGFLLFFGSLYLSAQGLLSQEPYREQASEGENIIGDILEQDFSTRVAKAFLAHLANARRLKEEGKYLESLRVLSKLSEQYQEAEDRNILEREKRRVIEKALGDFDAYKSELLNLTKQGRIEEAEKLWNRLKALRIEQMLKEIEGDAKALKKRIEEQKRILLMPPPG
jgi:serine/threonine-protein kinase